MKMKRTKIVCTIGPASEKPATIEAMIKVGMNVARLNMSHGTHAWHRKTIKTIKAVSKKFGEPVTLLADLQGPKIRLGELPEKGVNLKTGSVISFGPGGLPVTYKAMHLDVKPGHRIMIDDGILEVKVTKVAGSVVSAKVVNGGLVTSHKGMNFPDTTLRVDPITAKDKADVAFAVKAGVQWIAMSFVTSPKDVKRMRRIIQTNYPITQLPNCLPSIIVKIEKHEALKNFDAILKVADAIMVARGDLGVETAAEDVPLHQKTIIAKCQAAGKPVVVATQMLDSMIRNPRPTRAEVSDVANAVIDHTEAVMLSGETASGKYPVAAVQMMNKICLDTEASAFDDVKINSVEHKKYSAREHIMSSNELVSASVATLSRLRKIDAILTATALDKPADFLNRFRPESPIYLACATDHEARAWNIRWGIHPFVLKGGNAIRQLQKMKRLKQGDQVALIVVRDKKPQIEIVRV